MTDDPLLRPDFATAALITIDVQRDTLDGQPMEVPGTSAALPLMQALAAAFRAAGRPIVHMLRLYLADGSNVDLCRRRAVLAGEPLLLAGSPGSQLAPGLGPEGMAELDHDALLAGAPQYLATGEAIMYKPRWGAFFETALDDHLRDQDVTTLVVCGCNLPNCPRTSIYEASERDYRLVLARDAVSRLSPEAIVELEDIGVRVWPTSRIADAIGRASRSLPTA